MRRRKRRMTWRPKIETVRRQKSPTSSPLTPVFPHHIQWVMHHNPSYSNISFYMICFHTCDPSQRFSFSGAAVLIKLPFCVPVPGFRHGGVSWPYGPRWRQLSDHSRAATYSCDAGAGPDAASAALQAAGGQHDEERHPERPHFCCARTQVCDAVKISVYAGNHGKMHSSYKWKAFFCSHLKKIQLWSESCTHSS